MLFAAEPLVINITWDAATLLGSTVGGAVLASTKLLISYLERRDKAVGEANESLEKRREAAAAAVAKDFLDEVRLNREEHKDCMDGQRNINTEFISVLKTMAKLQKTKAKITDDEE